MCKPKMNKHLFTKIANAGAIAIADLPTRREKFTMPHDVSSVIDMERPWLKYAIPVASGVGTVAGYKLAKNKSLGLLSGMIGGNLVGSNVQSELERKYAKPYLKKVVEEVDKKYKSAAMSRLVDHGSGTEYIFDSPINWVHDLKEQTPANIRTALEYKNPVMSRLPVIGSVIGGAVSLKTKKLLPVAAGLGAGHIGRELYFDHKMKPYKAKYIAEAKKKYGIEKNARLDARVTGVLGGATTGYWATKQDPESNKVDRFMGGLGGGIVGGIAGHHIQKGRNIQFDKIKPELMRKGFKELHDVKLGLDPSLQKRDDYIKAMKKFVKDYKPQLTLKDYAKEEIVPSVIVGLGVKNIYDNKKKKES